MAFSKEYVKKIGGTTQRIEPEEGRTSIGGVRFELLDIDGEITAMIGADGHQFQNKSVVIKAGYQGMSYADFITIVPDGRVANLSQGKELTSWEFEVADVAKWTQRKIFRGASDSSPVTVQGNPINIFLAILTSTGNGTNGGYDWLDATDGLGIDASLVNVSGIESKRDTYYPGDSHYMQFTIKDRIKAKEFIEQEICKPLNCYWTVNGSGLIDIIPFSIPFSGAGLESFDQDDIIGNPEFDANFPATINEIEFSYNHDGDDFADIAYYAHADSINNRGAGKKPLVIKSRGYDTTYVSTGFLEQRANRVFARYADPPPAKISFTTFIDKWVIEPGQVVKFTHPRMPDLSDGTIGLTDALMEVVSRDIDWHNGMVKWVLLYTGFVMGNYAVISPYMTVVTGASGTSFTVSSADAAKFSIGWEVDIFDSGMRQRGSHVTITNISGTTITIDDLGETPQTGDIVQFSTYPNLTAAQKGSYAAVGAYKDIYW